MENVHGYIDRIENGQMVVIAETLRQEFIVNHHDYTDLQTGDWVVISLGKDSKVTDITINHQATQSRKKRIAQLKHSLKRR